MTISRLSLSTIVAQWRGFGRSLIGIWNLWPNWKCWQATILKRLNELSYFIYTYFKELTILCTLKVTLSEEDVVFKRSDSHEFKQLQMCESRNSFDCWVINTRSSQYNYCQLIWCKPCYNGWLVNMKLKARRKYRFAWAGKGLQF